MANETMTLISTVTVGSGGASSISFASIPSTYTDLVLLMSGRSTTSNIQGQSIRVNSNASTIYSFRRMEGSGSGVSSDSNTLDFLPAGTIAGTAQTANTFNNSSIYFPNYAGATNKSISADNVSENNATQAYQQLLAGLWANTAAITSITIFADYAQYSTASLYGILKGSGGASVS